MASLLLVFPLKPRQATAARTFVRGAASEHYNDYVRPSDLGMARMSDACVARLSDWATPSSPGCGVGRRLGSRACSPPESCVGATCVPMLDRA
jgi:hypothetical protein